jgi:hypothetical protein
METPLWNFTPPTRVARATPEGICPNVPGSKRFQASRDCGRPLKSNAEMVAKPQTPLMRCISVMPSKPATSGEPKKFPSGPETPGLSSPIERIAQYRALEQMALLRAETTSSAPLRQSYLELREGWARLAAHLEESLE